MPATGSMAAWHSGSARAPIRLGRESRVGAEWAIDRMLQRNNSLVPGLLLAFYASLSVLSLGIAAGSGFRGARMVMPFAGFGIALGRWRQGGMLIASM